MLNLKRTFVRSLVVARTAMAAQDGRVTMNDPIVGRDH